MPHRRAAAVVVWKNCGSASSCSATVLPGSNSANSSVVNVVTGTGSAMPSVRRSRVPVTVISSGAASAWACTGPAPAQSNDAIALANAPR